MTICEKKGSRVPFFHHKRSLGAGLHYRDFDQGSEGEVLGIRAGKGPSDGTLAQFSEGCNSPRVLWLF
jgi:hypothetical protein